MKIITLNLWSGILIAEILAFVKKYKDTDVFCFQEVFGKGNEEKIDWATDPKEGLLFEKIQKALPGHQGYFRPQRGARYGLASFVKKEFATDHFYEEYDEFVHKSRNEEIPAGSFNNPRNVQILSFGFDTRHLYVINFHGLYEENGKVDSEDRLRQSGKITEIIKPLIAKGNVVLCGDFNLRPDTKSLTMIEGCGLTNLNKRDGVLDTRTSHYPADKMIRSADYVLVSPELLVKGFEKLPDEVSDHAALRLKI